MSMITNYDFKGKRALIRVDFNVPLNAELKVTDDTRIRAAVPTIKHILDNGGSVVLMSHLGRPKDDSNNKYSLQNIVYKLEELIGTSVDFAGNCISDEAFNMTASLPAGKVVLLENLRYHAAEKAGTENFAERLAAHGDVYINDAFGTAHRAHASTAIIAKFFPNDKMFGFVINGELESLNKVLNDSSAPTTAIVGGAKVSGKILIISNLLDRIDNLIIGGGMSYTFIKAQGGKVGASLVEDDKLETAKEILADAKAKNVNVFIPTDTIVADNFSNDANTELCDITDIQDKWMGLDIGPDTITAYESAIMESKTILWNGPMGVFEMSKFEAGTKAMAHAIAKSTSNGAYSLIGGGDSVAAINKYELASDVSYVSTGGGAMLEYLEGKQLPGIQAIND